MNRASVVVLSLALAASPAAAKSPAYRAGRLPIPIPSPAPITVGPANLQSLLDFIKSDFAAAEKTATQIGDGNGLECWKDVQPVASVIGQHPVPMTFHVATDIEAQRALLISLHSLCESAACNQVFNESANAVSALIGGLPTINLTAICARVPPMKVAQPTSAK